jgi:hypothetical protein
MIINNNRMGRVQGKNVVVRGVPAIFFFQGSELNK